MRYTGRCACGAVALQMSAEPLATRQCWCRQCQTIAAGSATNNAIFPADAVQVTGEMGHSAWTAASGNTLTCYFCPLCGTHVMGRNSGRPSMTVVRFGVIDGPHDLAPQAVIWTEEAPAWAVLDPAIPHIARQSPPKS